MSSTIVLVGIILLSVFLVGGLTSLPVNHNTSTGIFTPNANTGTSTSGKSLQLNNLSFTPVIPPSTVTTTGTLDFSASTLDWEDVLDVLRINHKLTNLTPGCYQDLIHAVKDEIGNEEGNLPAATLTSRVGLCWQSKQCITDGYSAYPASLPSLPDFVPLGPCQQELDTIFQTIDKTHLPAGLPLQQLSGYQQEYADVFGTQNTNCDDSDWICKPLSEFCSLGPGVLLSSQFGAVCHP